MRVPARAMLRPSRLLALALLGAAFAVGCGDESEGGDNAVEATEQNAVELGGIRYRVPLFRELNTRTAPDRSVWSDPPEPGRGIYAAFVVACNVSDEPQPTAETIVLEDAFGEQFEALEPEGENRVVYQPQELEPDECTPGPNTLEENTFDGAAVPFSVPFESVQERPLVLQIEPAPGDPADAEPARIQLDV